MTDSLHNLATKVTTADLVDAMGRMHKHRCHILDMVTPTPGRALFGPASIISFFPTCTEALDPNRYNFASLFHEAIGTESQGRVLVLASNGHREISLGGGVKLSRAQRAGLAGVLADGRLRDFDELSGYDFATYCRGQATKWGGDVVTPFQANVPVVIDGVGIFPGDYVFADSSGAVIVPAGQILEVLEEAIRINEEDVAHLVEIEAEGPDDFLEYQR